MTSQQALAVVLVIVIGCIALAVIVVLRRGTPTENNGGDGAALRWKMEMEPQAWFMLAALILTLMTTLISASWWIGRNFAMRDDIRCQSFGVIRRFPELGVSKTAIAKLTGVSRTALHSSS